MTLSPIVPCVVQTAGAYHRVRMRMGTRVEREIGQRKIVKCCFKPEKYEFDEEVRAI